MKVLVIEDDVRIREEILDILKRENMEVEAVVNFEKSFEKAESFKGDIIILDINLPLRDGFSILRSLRKNSFIPVIILTSRSGDMEEILSMNLGADDFITKPFNPEILVLRINAIMKRMKDINNNLEYKGLNLDLSTGRAHFKDNEIELTRNEIGILSLLLKRRGNIVERDSIMEALWNDNSFVDENTLTVNINRLRKKLVDMGIEDDFIRTRRGMGYIVEW